jgi:hypothetical protein
LAKASGRDNIFSLTQRFANAQYEIIYDLDWLFKPNQALKSLSRNAQQFSANEKIHIVRSSTDSLRPEKHARKTLEMTQRR